MPWLLELIGLKWEDWLEAAAGSERVPAEDADTTIYTTALPRASVVVVDSPRLRHHPMWTNTSFFFLQLPLSE